MGYWSTAALSREYISKGGKELAIPDSPSVIRGSHFVATTWILSDWPDE
jgi:hypothetical protein